MWVLTIELPNEAARHLRLHAGHCSIGRSKDNTIPINHPSISRQHLSLDISDQQILIKDNGSRHKISYLNQTVDLVTVQEKTTIKIGMATLSFDHDNTPVSQDDPSHKQNDHVDDGPGKDLDLNNLFQKQGAPISSKSNLITMLSLLLIIGALVFWAFYQGEEKNALRPIILTYPFTVKKDYQYNIPEHSIERLVHPQTPGVIEVSQAEDSRKIIIIRTLDAGKASFDLHYRNGEHQTFHVTIYEDDFEPAQTQKEVVILNTTERQRKSQLFLESIKAIDANLNQGKLKDAYESIKAIYAEIKQYPKNSWQEVKIGLSRSKSKLRRLLEPRINELLSEADAERKRGFYDQAYGTYLLLEELMSPDDGRLPEIKRKIDILREHLSEINR